MVIMFQSFIVSNDDLSISITSSVPILSTSPVPMEIMDATR